MNVSSFLQPVPPSRYQARSIWAFDDRYRHMEPPTESLHSVGKFTLKTPEMLDLIRKSSQNDLNLFRCWDVFKKLGRSHELMKQIHIHIHIYIRIHIYIWRFSRLMLDLCPFAVYANLRLLALLI